MQKIEKGLMVMKNGKAWGIQYQDGRCTSYGWIDPVYAPIHEPEFLHKPEDVTYTDSPDISELRKGELVPVERKTTVKILKRTNSPEYPTTKEKFMSGTFQLSGPEKGFPRGIILRKGIFYV